MNTTMHLGGNMAQLRQLVSTRSLPPSSPPFASTLAHLPQPFIAAIPIHLLQPRPSLQPTASYQSPDVAVYFFYVSARKLCRR